MKIMMIKICLILSILSYALICISCDNKASIEDISISQEAASSASTNTIQATEIDSSIKEMTSDSISEATTEAIIESTTTQSVDEYADGEKIALDMSWKYADYTVINSGTATLYKADNNRNDKIIAVNAGHGTKGGTDVKTYCHPDKTEKVTGGTTSAGSIKAVAVSSGMTFNDGTLESKVTLREAQILKQKLLDAGYDVLMIRDGDDVQLDNIARTVIANNIADIHIAIHWDSDGLDTTKGVFYISVPDGIKNMEPVAYHWKEHEALGDALISGLKAQGIKIWESNPLDLDLTQTSYSTIPSVDIELGNQCSDHSDDMLDREATGLLDGINQYFGY